MIKDLELIKECEKEIRILNTEISKLTDERNKIYRKISIIEDKIDRYSRYNTEEIAEIIKDLMYQMEGIIYTVSDGIKDNINGMVIRPKDSIYSGPIFTLPYTKTCLLKPSNTIDNSKKNLYVYEFINFVYKERVKANMIDIDYSELSAILSEYLDTIKCKDDSKKLIK